MATTTQVTTFVDLYTDLQNRVRAATSVTATENQAKRYINIALMDMHIGFGEKFWWAERSAVLRTQATYATGSVDLTIGSATIAGNSTLWNTNNDFSVKNVRVGGKFTFSSNDVYEVLTVSSDTSVILTVPYIGATASASSYTYFEDEYALDSDFLKPLDAQKFSPLALIDLVDRRTFRRAYPKNNIPVQPTIATLIAKDPVGDVNVLKRIRFHKPPSSVHQIPYSFVTDKLAVSASGTLATALSADTDEPIVPLQYRHAIVLGALYNWYRDKKDDTRSQEVKTEYTELVSRMVGDGQIGVDPRPQISPRMGLYRSRARSPWRGGRGGRHVTGTAFDELRGR